MVIDEQKSASNSGYSISTITGDLKQGVKQAEEMLEAYKKYVLSEKGECSKEYAAYLKEKGKILV